MKPLRLFKDKSEFIAHCNHLARQYEEDVLSGVQIAPDTIKKAIIREQQIRVKYDYRQDKVDLVFSFLFFIYVTINNRPTQFVPAPWQAWIIMSIYGPYHKGREKRLRKYATIFISRKSGKTTLAAILSLFSLMKEERGAEVYFCGNTKDQASQALKYLKQIRDDSESIRKRVDKLQYQLRYSGNGTCYARPVANEPDKLDGLKPAFCIIDESHAFETKEMFNIMKTGMLATANPLLVQISTAGFYPSYPFANDVAIGVKVVNGEVEDDSTFYAIYKLDDEEAEVSTPDVWVKANPGIGFSIQLEDLIDSYKKASLTITDKRNFHVKNLNIWMSKDIDWIPDVDYRKCFHDAPMSELLGGRAWMGIDLSKTTDLAAIVTVVEHPVDKSLHILPHFFFPGGQEERKIRASGIDLTDWIERGFIEEHPDKRIDIDRVYDVIADIAGTFDLQMIGYDPYNAVDLVKRCETELFVDMKACKQNAMFFNFPLKYLEGLIISQDITMSTNPVLRWNFTNAVPYWDNNNNIRLVKNKAKESIDGAIAAAMAIGMYCETNWDVISNLLTNNES